MEVNKDWALLKTDISKAFSSVQRFTLPQKVVENFLGHLQPHPSDVFEIIGTDQPSTHQLLHYSSYSLRNWFSESWGPS
jgi:hypothetical protein